MNWPRSSAWIRSSSAFATTRQADPEKPDASFLPAQPDRVPAHRCRAVRVGRSATRRRAHVRDGRWLVGMGVAAAFRNNLLMTSAARVRLEEMGLSLSRPI